MLGRLTLSNKAVSNSLPSVCPLMWLFTLASPSLFPLNKRRFTETFHLSFCWKLQDSGLWGNLQTSSCTLSFLFSFFSFSCVSSTLSKTNWISQGKRNWPYILPVSHDAVTKLNAQRESLSVDPFYFLLFWFPCCHLFNRVVNGTVWCVSKRWFQGIVHHISTINLLVCLFVLVCFLFLSFFFSLICLSYTKTNLGDLFIVCNTNPLYFVSMGWDEGSISWVGLFYDWL